MSSFKNNDNYKLYDNNNYIGIIKIFSGIYPYKETRYHHEKNTLKLNKVFQDRYLEKTLGTFKTLI